MDSAHDTNQVLILIFLHGGHFQSFIIAFSEGLIAVMAGCSWFFFGTICPPPPCQNICCLLRPALTHQRQIFTASLTHFTDHTHHTLKCPTAVIKLLRGNITVHMMEPFDRFELFWIPCFKTFEMLKLEAFVMCIGGVCTWSCRGPFGTVVRSQNARGGGLCVQMLRSGWRAPGVTRCFILQTNCFLPKVISQLRVQPRIRMKKQFHEWFWQPLHLKQPNCEAARVCVCVCSQWANKDSDWAERQRRFWVLFYAPPPNKHTLIHGPVWWDVQASLLFDFNEFSAAVAASQIEGNCSGVYSSTCSDSLTGEEIRGFVERTTEPEVMHS